MPEMGGVRDYNRIRRFLSHIYLYGFFSREDFARSGIGSAKDYDYGMKLIRAIFPDSEQAALWRDGRKYPRFVRTYEGSGENRMTDSYLLHALDTETDLPELLILLAALAASPRTLEQLRRSAELHCDDEESDCYSRVRRRVLELEQYGYLQKGGRTFALAHDWLRQMENEELEALVQFVRFAAGTAYPRVAASFLRRSAEREMHRRGLPLPAQSLLLRHNVSACVFDEDIVWQLQELIAARRGAVITMGRGSVECLPIALRIDMRLGRWYVLSMEQRGPVIRRVSGIRSVKPAPAVPPEQWEEARQAVTARFARCGCSGAMPAGEPVLVRARLNFSSAPGLQNQFAREIRLGRIVEREDGIYYEAEVNDPLELLPLLRSYAPWLQVLPGAHTLDQRLREDLVLMRQAAEGACDETVQ